MTKDIVSLVLEHRILAPSAHWFSTFCSQYPAFRLQRLIFEWLNNWRFTVLTLCQEHKVKTICGDAGVCVNAHSHPVLFPLPSTSWHPFSRLTSSAHLFAFCIQSHWTFIVFHYTVEEQEMIFFLSLADTRSACSCILLAASFCLKWALHTVTGLTLHCWAHSLHTEVRLPSCTHAAHTNRPAQIRAQKMDEHVQRRGNAYTCASCRHRQHLTWVMLICYGSKMKSLQGETKQNNAASP